MVGCGKVSGPFQSHFLNHGRDGPSVGDLDRTPNGESRSIIPLHWWLNTTFILICCSWLPFALWDPTDRAALPFVQASIRYGQGNYPIFALSPFFSQNKALRLIFIILRLFIIHARCSTNPSLFG